MESMTLTKKITWITLFSIAMGFMETAVVVYLRKIYYPEGFQFPLVAMETRIVLTELVREAATIIMLLAIGILTGKTTAQKFAYFIFSFAIWDLFYYVFLKVLLNWPESLATYDILFLIPLPWVGPVWAPCIIALTMIVLAMSIIYLDAKGYSTTMQALDWLTFSLGSFVVICSFLTNDIHFIKSSKERGDHMPMDSFNWLLFWMGEIIIVIGLLVYFKRNRNRNEFRMLAEEHA